MNYTKLFDTIYSDIAEELKEEVVERVLDEAVMRDVDFLEESIHESDEKVSAYQEALSYLINSDITEESLMESLDIMFENETDEVIGKVEEAFKEDVAKGILVGTLLEDYEKSKGNILVPSSSIRNPQREERIRKSAEASRKQAQAMDREAARKANIQKAREFGSKVVSGAKSALGKLKDSVSKVFARKDTNSNIGKGDGSFRSKRAEKTDMNKGTGEFRGKSSGAAPIGLAAIRRAHGEEPIQRGEGAPKKSEETSKKVSFQDDFAGKIKGAAEERKEKVQRGEGSVRTGKNVSDSAFDVEKQNKENKEMSKPKEAPSETKSEEPKKSEETQQLSLLNNKPKETTKTPSRNSAKLEARITGLRDKIKSLEGEKELTSSQKGQLTRARNTLNRLVSANEALEVLPKLFEVSEAIITSLLEMKKPNYDAVLKRDEEKGANLVNPLSSNPEVSKEKQDEIATHHEKVQARKDKYSN